MKDYHGFVEPREDQLKSERSSSEAKGDYRSKDDYILIWLILLGLTILVSAYLVFLR